MEKREALRVGFMGVPGSGKSTVAQAVQVEMGSHDCLTAVCPEYAREFITKNGPPEHIAIQQSILFKQLRKEDTLAHGIDVLFSDSPVYFCYLYALLMADPSSKQQQKILRNLYKWGVLDHLERYDLLIWLPRQFEVIDDSVRKPEMTETIEGAMQGFVNTHKHLFPNYVEIWSEEEDPKAILKDRVKQIKRKVNVLLKERTEED